LKWFLAIFLFSCTATKTPVIEFLEFTPDINISVNKTAVWVAKSESSFGIKYYYLQYSSNNKTWSNLSIKIIPQYSPDSSVYNYPINNLTGFFRVYAYAYINKKKYYYTSTLKL
jgi:hypothetical protein